MNSGTVHGVVGIVSWAVGFSLAGAVIGLAVGFLNAGVIEGPTIITSVLFVFGATQVAQAGSW